MESLRDIPQADGPALALNRAAIPSSQNPLHGVLQTPGFNPTALYATTLPRRWPSNQCAPSAAPSGWDGHRGTNFQESAMSDAPCLPRRLVLWVPLYVRRVGRDTAALNRLGLTGNQMMQNEKIS